MANNKTKKTYCLLPLNQVIGLPGDEHSFSLNNKDLIQLVRDSLKNKKEVVTTLQQPFSLEKECSVFGVKAIIIETEEIDRSKLRFKLKFLEKVEITQLNKVERNLEANIHLAPKQREPKNEDWAAFTDEIWNTLKKMKGQINLEAIPTQVTPLELDFWSATIARVMEFKHEDRVQLMNGWAFKKRMQTLLTLVTKYHRVHSLRKQIRKKANDKIQRINRDALLEEERKAIEHELHRGKKNIPPELQYLKDQIDQFQGTEEALKVLEHEFEKLMRIGTGSPGSSVIQDYLEAILDLPWNVTKDINQDWDDVEKTLLNSHFGLQKVKDHILRYLAVALLSQKPSGNILCLVGPPGVGKTSFAKAIAEALQLPFIKKSLGGVRDESEIRGHRRTYVGAIPGRIMQGLRKAGCSNPIFLLDEVDKMGRDHRGSPADALLEVLDPEDNHRFSDHYIELEFDLSKVFWVLTANSEDHIPGPLRDRLDIIKFSGYTQNEKLSIAKNYLTTKSMKKLGLDQFQLNLSESVIKKIIHHYTREPGVRDLSRKISSLAQHMALQQVRGGRRKKWSPPQKF